MRKTLLVLLTLTTLVGFSACSKDDDPYYSPNKSFTELLTIENWQYDSDKNYWFYDLNVPELDDYYIKNGTVAADISYKNDKVYESIPSTYDGVTFNFDYTNGNVRVYYRWGETRDEVLGRPDFDCTIKVILSDADAI